MIKFYYMAGPNPMKVALMLEETGLPYEVTLINVGKGEQFTPELTAINPNNKLPVIIDGDTTVFDSNAILLYLAEKTGQFLPETGSPGRGELLSWLMFVASGVGPYTGQAVHFIHYAPEPKTYGVERYSFEARRHYGILNARLADREWMLGDRYTIVDMAVWGWARILPSVFGPEVKDEFPHLKRLLNAIKARPAAVRAVALKDRFPLEMKVDDEFRRNMFRFLPKE
jgi:GST-like protein